MAPKRKIDPAPPPSRTPRRLLAERGLVESFPGRGTFVAESEAEVTDADVFAIIDATRR